MVSGGKLMFGLGEVEGAAVGFGSGRNHVYYKGDYSGHVSFEEEPCVFLGPDEFADIERSGKHADRDEGKTQRELVTYHLRAASHGADKRILIVGRPSGKQNTEHSD